jgi:hypothetical protein
VPGKPDDAVQLAIARAASNYSAQEWHELPSRDRVRAIFHELRQLDEAVARRPQDVKERAAPAPTRRSRSGVK